MQYRQKLFALLASMLVLSSLLTAQAATRSAVVSPRAVIEFASSDDVIIIRNAKRLSFTDIFGLELFDGDQVQTGRGVSLEMRLSDNKGVIRVTENTTFVLETPSPGQTGLKLVYGRLRAKMEKLSGNETFSVSSQGAVAGVRGTDFGFDYVALRASAIPSPRVYCFEGVVEVTALVRTPATQSENLEPVVKRFVLEGGTMVSIQPASSTLPTEVQHIEKEVRDYWVQNDFEDKPGVPQLIVPIAPEQKEGETVEELLPSTSESLPLEPALAAPTVAPELAPPLVPEPVSQQALADKAELLRLRRSIGLKNGGITAGSLLSATGIGLCSFALFQLWQGQSAMASQFFLYGTIISGAALPFFVISLFFN